MNLHEPATFATDVLLKLSELFANDEASIQQATRRSMRPKMPLMEVGEASEARVKNDPLTAKERECSLP